MSSRKNGSVSRAAEAASKNRLHMDRNPTSSRITDPSNPAGRRKEIDNVMKRARQGSPGTWDRKLLEVEEKDPNRWRHSGYKQLYLDGSRSSSSPRRSRTPVRKARSPVARRSPIPRRSPGRRSPVLRRSPVPRRSPVRRSRSRSIGRASRSPIRRDPRRDPRRVVPGRVRESPRRIARPPSPPEPRQSSPSGSSSGSCSDESCSVCSAKNKKAPPPPPKPKKPVGAVSPPRKRLPRPSPPKAVQPTRELLKAREASKRSREEKVLEWQRAQLAVRAGAPPAPPGAPAPPTAPGAPAAPAAPGAPRIKREGERRAPPRPAAPRVSPAAIQRALNDSGSDSASDASSDHQPPRLTLSERFGKMAQWSLDRSARLENMNMRITRRDATLHVRIEKDARGLPVDEDLQPEMESEPVGSYPEELLAAAPGGLPSWDDVRVRYDYYKKRGYLRGLTLGDYVKWEEWWYKYQEWLKRERAYERWADGEPAPRRERRRRGGRHRRS